VKSEVLELRKVNCVILGCEPGSFVSRIQVVSEATEKELSIGSLSALYTLS
jgi:hypothetical protein